MVDDFLNLPGDLEVGRVARLFGEGLGIAAQDFHARIFAAVDPMTEARNFFLPGQLVFDKGPRLAGVADLLQPRVAVPDQEDTLPGIVIS